MWKIRGEEADVFENERFDLINHKNIKFDEQMEKFEQLRNKKSQSQGEKMRQMCKTEPMISP